MDDPINKDSSDGNDRPLRKCQNLCNYHKYISMLIHLTSTVYNEDIKQTEETVNIYSSYSSIGSAKVWMNTTLSQYNIRTFSRV